MNVLRLAKNVRSLRRLRQIITVLTQHGFGHVVDRMNLRRFSPIRRWRETAAGDPLEASSIGHRLAEVCSELGPTFVKFGQMATTRPDIFAADIRNELQSLQDRVPPFDTDVGRQVIEEGLGAPIDQLFRSLSEEPIACGSIGQVYRAVLDDGTKVVVKVKRPGIDETIRSDLYLLKILAEAMEGLLPELAVYQPMMLVDELEQVLIRELDFTHEAASTTKLRDALENDAEILIPQVYWELCTPRVLVLKELQGQNIQAAIEDDSGLYDRKLLASRLTDVYIKQLFDVGTFHADPHAGNIFVSKPATIGLIDFGQTGTVSDSLVSHLAGMMVAVAYRDTELVVDLLEEMEALSPDADRRDLVRDLRILEDKYYGLPLRRIDLVVVFEESTNVMRRHGVSIPRDLVLVLKTMSTAFGIVMQLDPEFDLMALLRTRLVRIIRGRLAPGRFARTAAVTGFHGLALLRDAPQRLRQTLKHLAAGRWQINVKHERIDQLIAELDRTGNRLSFSVMIAGIVVGSSMVITAGDQVAFLGIPLRWFGVVGYLFAGVFGVGLLWAIFRSGRLS